MRHRVLHSLSFSLWGKDDLLDAGQGSDGGAAAYCGWTVTLDVERCLLACLCFERSMSMSIMYYSVTSVLVTVYETRYVAIPIK